MKELLTLIILIGGVELLGQDSLRAIDYGVTIGIGPSPPVGRTDYAFHGGISAAMGRHHAFGGIILAHSIDDTLKFYPGVDLGYRLYPIGKHRRLDFFLSYDFQFYMKKIVQDLIYRASLFAGCASA